VWKDKVGLNFNVHHSLFSEECNSLCKHSISLEGQCICATVVAKWKGFNYSRGYGIPIALFLLGWIKLIPYVMHITMQLGQSSFST
jgi:hypothetical protein